MIIRFCVSLIFLAILYTFIFFFSYFSKQPEIVKYSSQELKNWGVEWIGVSALWKEGLKGKGVNIAIMDSGIDYDHPEFSTNIKPGFNAINPRYPPLDDYGHGTLITGIIAAQHDNNIGFQGVAPEANIYPVKVLDHYGRGSIEDIERGIDWCIQNKINIINMSFSIPKDNISLHRSIQKATSKGIIIVASVANSYGGNAGYPASYDEVISVTAIDSNLHFGETTPVGNIDFSAPGVDIISTSMGGSYHYESGTSIAAPFVSGLIALFLEKDISTSKNTLEVLKEYSSNRGEARKDEKYGWGILKVNITEDEND